MDCNNGLSTSHGLEAVAERLRQIPVIASGPDERDGEAVLSLHSEVMRAQRDYNQNWDITAGESPGLIDLRLTERGYIAPNGSGTSILEEKHFGTRLSKWWRTHRSSPADRAPEINTKKKNTPHASHCHQ